MNKSEWLASRCPNEGGENRQKDRQPDAFAHLNRVVDEAVMAKVGSVLVTTKDLNAVLDRVRSLESALNKIAAGITPPEQHGHYLAHREAVRVAREAVRAQ